MLASRNKRIVVMTGCKEHGQALNPTVIVQYVPGYFWLTDLQFLQLTESTVRVWLQSTYNFKIFGQEPTIQHTKGI